MIRAEAQTVAEAWFEALLSGVALNAFCLERFGREPSIQLGTDPFNLQGEPDAPFVVVVPMQTKDGPDLSAAEGERIEYRLMLALGLEDGAVESVGGRGRVFRGYRSAAEFEARALQVLMDSAYRPAVWESETAQPGENYFERHVFITVTAENTIGGF
ncbi:hypothetical protein [Desulfovibrio aminophilus]|uniref:hypothetical protein n=1 Tax=Desulfovibrio aminophilus TaxID=81425 RepID=UPI0003F7250D|nr:hypothetical protein [Desulfovibrio aminophilus]